MPSFLDSVADLTDPRDTNLDGRLAAVVLDFVQASTVSLWFWAARDGDVTLGQCFTTGSYGLPVDGRQPEIGMCRMAAVPSRRLDSLNGHYHHVFPVTDTDERGLALDILRASPLVTKEAKSILALARIYRNLLGHLDCSRNDALTGLLNRRTFDTSFEKAVQSETSEGLVVKDRRDASNDGAASHIAVVDIDHFKRVNDRFGHLYGDEVLVLLARLMKYCFRESDSLFRFGGEEFVVILRGTTPEQANIALERFRAAVERFAFPQVGTVTVSIGFTAIQGDDNGPNAFGRADEALYVAKRAGRNRICSHETLTMTGVLTHSRVQHDHNVEMFA